MSNKIIVEFDEARIKEWCELQKIYPSSYCPCYNCKQTNKEQIECMLMEGGLYIESDYKIKKQNNEIITKFNVGDKIYVIYYNTNEKKYFIKEMKIYYITCYVEYDNTIKVNYSIHDLQWKNDTDCIAEEYCFATKEEAEQECKRRNEK